MTAIAPLLLDLPPLGAEAGGAFVVFDQQDSGCISYGLAIRAERYFVKRSTTPAARDSLLTAIRFHEAVEHPAIARPVQADAGDDVTLVYPWIDGTVLNHATIAGSDRSGLSAFRSLPVPTVERAITTILDAHVAVVEAGFVSVDFYDGAMLYDFDRAKMHLIDLDEYRPGPFEVQADRLPGSRSYMAPEEWTRGATIDERTVVFGMGRTIQHLLSSDDATWRGTPAQQSIAATATSEDPADRYSTVGELLGEWNEALTCS